MDAAGVIYVYYTAIFSAGLVCLALLLIAFYQYGNHKRVNRKVIVSAAFSFTAFIAVFWEPIVTSMYVIPSICKEQGGLFIYEKAHANGFYQNVFKKEYLTDFGFSFIEYPDYSDYTQMRYVTKTIGLDGKIKVDTAWEGKRPQSRYHYITNQKLKNRDTGIMKYFNVRAETSYVLDTRSNKVLGEIKKYLYSGKDLRYAMYRLLADKKRTCWSQENDPKGIPLPVHILQPSRL